MMAELREWCYAGTAYRLPLTAYRLPLTAYRLPLTAYRLPLTAYRLPLTAYRYPPDALPEPDPHRSLPFRVSPHGDFVAVLEECALLAGGEGEGLGAAPGELEEAAAVLAVGARDGAAGEEVAGVEVAAVARVVGEHLGRGPVEVGGAGAAEAEGRGVVRAHSGRGEPHFDGHVEGAVRLVARVGEVGERARVA